MIKGLQHVGISVADLDRSIDFYGKLLGLQLVERGSFQGELYEQIMALDGVTGRFAILQAHGMEIELFEFSQPRPQAVTAPRPVSDYGISHFCVEVEDIDHEYERLKAAGVRFHCRPVGDSAARATYARDPDGNVFELLEIMRPT